MHGNISDVRGNILIKRGNISSVLVSFPHLIVSFSHVFSKNIGIDGNIFAAHRNPIGVQGKSADVSVPGAQGAADL
jgi:hypothetical protein